MKENAASSARPAESSSIVTVSNTATPTASLHDAVCQMTNGKPETAKKGFGGRDGRQTPGDRFRKAFDKASDRPSRRSADKDNRPERRPRRDNENGSSFNTRGREDRQRNPRGRRFADSPYPFQKKEKTGLQIEGKTPSLPPSDRPDHERASRRMENPSGLHGKTRKRYR